MGMGLCEPAHPPPHTLTQKCVLVADCSDEDHLDDAHCTLEDAFEGGSFLSKSAAPAMESDIVASTGSLVHLGVAPTGSLTPSIAYIL